MVVNHMKIDDYLKALADWGRFADGLRSTNGVLSINDAFIPRVLAAAQSLVCDLATPVQLYRARILPAARTVPFSSNEMGAPPPTFATGGRLNPPGVSYLYMAESPETAVAELRPWVRAQLCVATLVPIRAIRFADLTATTTLNSGHEMMRVLSRMLAQPAHRDDNVAYVATQHVAECLRAAGIEGVRYESSLRPQGWNIVVFDPTLFNVGTIELHEVQQVEYSTLNKTAIASFITPP